MSKLFDFSSLAMIPTAYKDGKLYSVRPTDGSGDFTFSRGSNLAATRVDVNGLIEKGRENYILHSNNFGDATWSKTRSSFVSGQAGYDGSNDAWAFVDNTNNSTHLIVQNITSSQVATFSVYAKAGAVNFLVFRYEDANVDYAYFDLANGTLGTIDYDYIDAKITSVGGGWYRCEASRTSAVRVVLLSAQSDNDPTYAGAGNTALYIQDAQLEQGLVATEYIETGASTAQAGILEDMPRLDYSGGASCPSLLLEPQRSNKFLYSEYYGSGALGIYQTGTNTHSVTNNYSVSPEGTQNAIRFVADITSVGDRVVLRDGVSCGGGNHTLTFYAKSNTTETYTMKMHFDGSGKKQIEVTPEWQRFEYGESANSTCNAGIECSSASGYSASVDISVYGFQLEENLYPTSYIPTYGSSVTRSNDSGVLTSLPDSLADNYTIFLELERMVPSLTNAVDMFSFYGSGSSRIRIQSHNPNYFRVRLYAADGSTSGSLYETSGDFAQGNNYKAAIVYSNGTFKCFANGSLFGTQNVVIDISSAYLRTECISKQLLTFPTALTDSECIALTTL